MSDEDVVSAVRRIDESADSAERGDDEATAETTGTTDAAPGGEPPAVDDLTGPERRLDGRVRYLWGAQAAVVALVVGAVVGVASFALAEQFWPGVGAFTVLFLAGIGLTVVRYRRWRYEVREDSLLLERGVYAHVRTVVPYVRIQHVDVSRGPFERALGLASIVVYTAGSRGADVTIPGLTPERADDLQRRLKRLAIVADGDDAV